MTELDPYQVLGIEATATDEQVREAYRRLARLVHPDTAPEWEDDEDCTRWMMMLNDAYAVLRDPLKRAQYDRMRLGLARHAGAAQARSHRRPGAYYETPQAIRTYVRPDSAETPARRPPAQGWPEVVFEDTKTAQFAFGAFLAGMALYTSLISLTAEPLWFVLPVGILGAAIAAIHVIAVGTSLSGYLVLGKASLIERWTFAWFRKRSYRYEQICDVNGDERSRRIAIDYYLCDSTGQVDRSHRLRRWLRSAHEYDALLKELRARTVGLPGDGVRPAPQPAGAKFRRTAGSVGAIASAVVLVLGLVSASWFLYAGGALLIWAAMLLPELR
jgi:curved DNA-binding protein CbpA